MPGKLAGLLSATEIVRVVRGHTLTHQRLRSRLVAVAVTSLVVDVVAAGFALLFERHAPQTAIHDYGDAIFWTTTQLLTVSSQLPNPLTTAGRTLDVLLEAYGITVVATLAGSFSAFFHRRSMEHDGFIQPVRRGHPDLAEDDG